VKRQPSVTEALALIATEMELSVADAPSWRSHEKRYDHDRHCVWPVTDDPRSLSGVGDNFHPYAFRTRHKYDVVVRGESP
jgi:hypothetical protein